MTSRDEAGFWDRAGGKRRGAGEQGSRSSRPELQQERPGRVCAGATRVGPV